MAATVRLMQVDGVVGPVGQIESDDLDAAARAWAEGQTGHPWDVLVVEPVDGEAFEIEL